MEVVIKQPSEQYPVGIDYTGNLPFGATLSSGAASAINIGTNLDATAVVIQNTVMTISGSIAKVIVKGGVSGVRYKVTTLVTLSDNSILEEDFTLAVQAI